MHRLRDECLNGELCLMRQIARQKLENWRRDYSEQRPHGALRIEPFEFVQSLGSGSGPSPSQASLRQARIRVKGPLTPGNNRPPLTRTQPRLPDLKEGEGLS
jgi:hypothetical protein